MLVNGPTDYAISRPGRADFEGYADSEEDYSLFDKTTKNGATWVTTKESAEGVYTAELNFRRRSSSVALILSMKSDSEYYKLSFEGNQMVLYRVTNGNASKIAAANVGGFITEEGMTPIRVEAGYAKTCIYLDAMRKITLNYGIGAGKIGYIYRGNATPSFTAFSNDCFGSSDFDAIKNLPTKFSAVHYLKGENRGFSIANARVNAEVVR